MSQSGLSRLLNLPVPRFPHLQTGDHKCTCHMVRTHYVTIGNRLRTMENLGHGGVLQCGLLNYRCPVWFSRIESGTWGLASGWVCDLE